MDATESGIKTEEKKKRTEEDLTKNNLASNLLKSSEMPFFLEKCFVTVILVFLI